MTQSPARWWRQHACRSNISRRVLTSDETTTFNEFRKDSGDDEFYGKKTIRIQGLAAKSRQFVDSILLNNILLGIADQILLPSCGNYWMSQAETIYISPGNSTHAEPVEMKQGDALIYLGGLAHGGGANTSTDRIRKALYIGFLLGWLTPEEAVPLAIPAEIAQTLPDRARALLGLSGLHGNMSALPHR